MNFDRLAPYYPWMERFMAGGLMQRCRTEHLARTKDRRRALLAGEGTGKFLTTLLRFNPRLQVTCVEHSQKMIGLARRRLDRAGLDVSRVQFKQMDALDWVPEAQPFDLVVTHFFLDCFRADQLEKLVPLLAGSTTPDALWLLADFRLPEQGWQRLRARLILGLLYAFFQRSTALSTNQLAPPDVFLRDARFNLAGRRLASFGLMHSDVWEKKRD